MFYCIISSDERKIGQVFNLYCSGITQSLGIYHRGENCVQTSSIINIKSHFKSIKSFLFQHVAPLDVYNLISNINCRKKPSGTIPNKILKRAASDCYIVLTDCINPGISESRFPDNLKFADITPIHKK